ncbi:MAG: 3-oxoacyl-[acyl-carrier-protein] reductase [Rhodospirillales bacterium]|nr:3-oxoacyl-[acyl-carrier-protein] reductase [Rhodospirillales bacterium]
MFALTGRKALVTGASGGIGGAIARALYAQGAEVVLAGRRREALDDLARELGERTHVLTANLGSAEADKGLAKAAEEAMGQVDILVNNAGVTADTLAMRMKDEDWQRILDLNLTSGFRIIRTLLHGMLKRRHGRVIGITSVVGVTGNPGQANYAAAKAGIIGMSKALAQEVAERGITVNCVAPGFIETAMTDGLPDQVKVNLLGRIPVRRLGSSEDIAAAVAYLASDEAAYVTGQTVHVNGGMAMI